MYTEDLTIDTIDESELFGADNWQHNYAELAEQYLDGSENDDIVREAFPAIIAALAPLIPTIVQGVTSLFNRPAANTIPTPSAPTPRPRMPRPAPRRFPTMAPAIIPSPVAAPPTSTNAASSLLSLLQNPQVLAAITALAQGITGAATGSTGATVPVGDIVNTIGGLAGQIGGIVSQPTGESSYLYNEFGDRVESTNDPIEQANTITALLN